MLISQTLSRVRTHRRTGRDIVLDDADSAIYLSAFVKTGRFRSLGSMVCVHCGKDVPEVSTFCLHCGKSPQPKPPRVFSTRTLVLVVALTVVVCALGGAFAYRVVGNRSQSTVAAPVAAPAQPQTGQSGETIAKPSSVQQQHEFASEELFKVAALGVVLVEVFDESGEKRSTGSGFAVGNGQVVTNYHVIRGAYHGTVHYSDGTQADISGVMGHNAETDVAILRVTEGATQPLKLGDSDQLQVGNRVFAIGSPKGFQNTISDGLVSGVRNGLIQTSTPISPGSSGGPFFNIHGEVVGIAVSGILDAENLNFVVPINRVKQYLNSRTLTTLSELSEQNTVVHEILNSTISVPAKQRESWPITIDRNHMANPELQGSFTSSGGMGGNVRVLVASQQGGIIYDSGRANSGSVNLALQSGRYVLVVDNTGSIMFPRSVTADFKLKYVK